MTVQDYLLPTYQAYWYYINFPPLEPSTEGGSFNDPPPGTTVTIDFSLGSDGSNGFTAPIKTLTRLNEVLRTYNWGGQDVNLVFQNFTAPFDFDGSGILGIKTLNLLLTGNNFISDSAGNITNFRGVENLKITDLVINGNSRFAFSNIYSLVFGTTGANAISAANSNDATDIITLSKVYKLKTGKISLANITFNSCIKVLKDCLLLDVDFSQLLGVTAINGLIDITAPTQVLTLNSSGVMNIAGRVIGNSSGNPTGPFIVNDFSSITGSLENIIPDNATINASDFSDTIAQLGVSSQKLAIDKLAAAVNVNFPNPATLVIYADSARPDNNGDGLTEAEAFKDLFLALNQLRFYNVQSTDITVVAKGVHTSYTGQVPEPSGFPSSVSGLSPISFLGKLKGKPNSLRILGYTTTNTDTVIVGNSSSINLDGDTSNLRDVEISIERLTVNDTFFGTTGSSSIQNGIIATLRNFRHINGKLRIDGGAIMRVRSASGITYQVETPGATLTSLIELQNDSIYDPESFRAAIDFVGPTAVSSSLIEVTNCSTAFLKDGSLQGNINNFDNLPNLTLTGDRLKIVQSKIAGALFDSDNVLGGGLTVDDFSEYNNSDYANPATAVTTKKEALDELYTVATRDRQVAQRTSAQSEITVLADGSPTPTPWETIEGMVLTSENTTTAKYEFTVNAKAEVSNNNRTIQFALFINNIFRTEIDIEIRLDQAGDDKSKTTYYDIDNVAPSSLCEIKRRNVDNPTTLTIGHRYFKMEQIIEI